jgi:enoyl-CoA hydratase/carnithine racemase
MASPSLPFGYDVSKAVATITFDRPDKLNALTIPVYRQLTDLLYRLRSDSGVHAVVITGKGKGFCSGGDVDEIIGQLFAKDSRDILEFTRMTGELIENIRRLDKPVIAAVNGTAAGAGAVIALACDFRLVADTARFHFLFTKVGLAGADMGAAWLLPRIVGLGRATEWLMLGDGIDARMAFDAGLVTKIVPRDRLEHESLQLARRLATGPHLAVSMTKRLLNNEASMDFSSAIESEAIAQALLLRAQDHKAFYEAHKAGGTPRFTGR